MLFIMIFRKPNQFNMKSNAFEFTEKAIAVHGDRYDYEDVCYVDSTTKVNIFCRLHGIFEQRPDHHLEGKGCYICGGGGKKFSQDTVINQFKAIHGEKYDYSLVEYINGSSKVKIKCNTHQLVFEQLVSDHKRGRGCLLCSGKIPKTYSGAAELIKDRWGERFKLLKCPDNPKLISKITVYDNETGIEMTLTLGDLISAKI